MTVERAEGVVLQAQPYQDHHHIATIFTRDQGVIRLFVRGTSRIRRNSHAIVSPLTRAEFHFTAPKSGALYRMRDASLLDQYLPLRQDYDRLEGACALANTIASSQFLWKPAPALYQLLVSSFAQLAKEADPTTVRAAFLLKLLRHEGLLVPVATCSRCGTELEMAHIASGEILCQKCTPSWAISLLPAEWLHISQVIASTSWTYIPSIDSHLLSTIKRVYDSLVS